MSLVSISDMDNILSMTDGEDDSYSSNSDSYDSSSGSDSEGNGSGSGNESNGEGSADENALAKASKGRTPPKTLLLDITEMKNQLQLATEEGDSRDVLNYLQQNSSKMCKFSDDGDQNSIMSFNAVATLRNKMNPLVNRGMYKSASTGMLRERCVQIVQAQSAQDGPAGTDASQECDVKPDECLRSLLELEGISTKPCPASSLEDFFVEWKEEHTAAFSAELVGAIRKKDINKVKLLHANSLPLLACNKFGESVVHMMCRHGDTELLKFFMLEAHVPIRLKDDSGRTPLHDACWTSILNFGCVELILKACPDMLFICDDRGFTPLAYIPRSRWGDWCSFLENKTELLKPKELMHLVANKSK